MNLLLLLAFLRGRPATTQVLVVFGEIEDVALPVRIADVALPVTLADVVLPIVLVEV